MIIGLKHVRIQLHIHSLLLKISAHAVFVVLCIYFIPTDKWECEYSCILFEGLIYQGTFKEIHRADIGTHSIVVKKLKSLLVFVYVI